MVVVWKHFCFKVKQWNRTYGLYGYRRRREIVIFHLDNVNIPALISSKVVIWSWLQIGDWLTDSSTGHIIQCCNNIAFIIVDEKKLKSAQAKDRKKLFQNCDKTKSFKTCDERKFVVFVVLTFEKVFSSDGYRSESLGTVAEGAASMHPPARCSGQNCPKSCR